MSVMSSRIVAVFGATGLQGSAIINAILKDGTFTPRAITRDLQSEAALTLQERGVEIVRGSPSDKASLIPALKGSEAVFAVTIPTLFSAPGTLSEAEQGRNIVDAAKEAGVKFFVFSSLPSMSEISGGKYSVPHCEEKAAVQKYLQASGLANASILLGGFLENFWHFGPQLKKTATGFDIPVPYSPTAKQAFTWVSKDVSDSVVALLKNYTDPSKSVSGKAYPVVTEAITFPELAAITSKVLGVEVTFTSIPTSGSAQMDATFACQAEYDGLYTATPVPNPELVALGVKFGSVQEFVETEVKRRFIQ